MKNNKGFTLVELIAVLALLAIIMVISFVSIISVIDDSKIKDCNNQLKSIQTAAKEYVSDNRYKNEFVNQVAEENMLVTIEVSDLNLSDSITDPFDKNGYIYNSSKNINNIYIKVILNDDYTAKEVIVYNSSSMDEESKVNCSNKKW